MATIEQVNCSFPLHGSPDVIPSPLLQPNSDIAGIGVIISFVATACLTFLLVLLHYLLDCSPQADQNIIDRGIVRGLHNTFNLKRPEWSPAILQGVLMFSDQQLFTGIAILGAGYSQLPNDLPAYYWQFVLQLAWFSSITHLTTLTLLRQYFWQNPAARRWRVGLMIMLAGLQIVGLIPTSWADWPLNISTANGFVPGLGTPAKYYFTRNFFDGSSTSLVDSLSLAITLMYLIFSYATRLIKLSKSTSLLFRTWLRLKPGDQIKRALKNLHGRMCRSSTKIIWRGLHRALLVVFAILRAAMDIAESMLWEYVKFLSYPLDYSLSTEDTLLPKNNTLRIIWLFWALVLGMVKLFQLFAAAAAGGTSAPTTTSGNKAWSFGQWLPLLLLGLPILSMAETICETRTELPYRPNATTSPTSSPIMQQEPITYEDRLAQAWPDDSYHQAWFRWLIAMMILSYMNTLTAVLAVLVREPKLLEPIGALFIDEFLWPFYSLVFILAFSTLFVCLESVQLRGIRKRLLMSILPGFLVITYYICVAPLQSYTSMTRPPI